MSKQGKEQVKIDRKALVSAAKDMNTTLGLNPKIKFKDDKGEPRTDKAIADDVAKYAKGFDDETGKYVKDNAVSRESDDLQDGTWEVLELLGAVAKVEKPEPKKGKSKKEEKTGIAKKGLDKEDKKLKQSGVRAAGRLPKDFKSLKTALEAVDKNAAIARQFDKLLLTKQTLGEHLKAAAKLGGNLSLITHLRYRYEISGFDFKDTRKFQSDEDGIIQLIGLDADVNAANPRKSDLPASKGGKAEKPTKKAGKKATKEVDEDDEEEADEKPAKKSGKKEVKAEKPAKKGKGKPAPKDEEDDESDEDEADEKPAKKAKKSKK